MKYAESSNHGMGGAIVDNMSALRVWYNTMSYAGILYGAAWDFFQDWSVFRLVKKENGWYKLEFFKRRMMCKRVELYYFAVVFNSVLRNKWIYASLSAVQDSTTVGDEVWATIWSAAEVIRRCFWNYFRVENEHATNCGMFRATLDVPLPYADGDLTDEEEEEEEEQTKKPEREKPKGLAGFRAAARTVALSQSARWIRRRRQRQRRRPPDGLPQHADVQVPLRPRPKRRRRRGRHLRTIRTLERVGVEVEVQIDRAQARRRRRRGRRIRIRIAAKKERRGRGNRQDDLAQK